MYYLLTIETTFDSHLDHPTSSTSKQSFDNIKEIVDILLHTLLNKDELTHIEYDIEICHNDVDDFESPYGHHNGIAPS